MCILNISRQCFLMFSDIKYLTETRVLQLINQCKGPDPYNDHNELLCVLYQVFSTPEALGNSFIKRPQSHKKYLLKCYNLNTISSSNMTKEKVSTL